MDISNVYDSYVKTLEYLKTTFLPKSKVSGVKFTVYVVSDDVIVAHISSVLIEADEHNKIYSKVFSDLSKAESWISENLKSIWKIIK